jgi:RNA polymerase sigma-70 factor, ECF subfamily
MLVMTDRIDRPRPDTPGNAAVAAQRPTGEAPVTGSGSAPGERDGPGGTGQSPAGAATHGRDDSAYHDQVRAQFIARLHTDHGDFLVAFVMRLTGGDRHWAEDVVQETLLRAWRHADALLGGGAPSMLPWLTTVARRIVSNDRRSRRARPQEVDPAPLEVLAVPDETERALHRAILIDALKGMAVAHRRVVVEMYLRGRTVEEVSRVLGVPPGTVKSRSFYAMRALRAALRQRGVDP